MKEDLRCSICGRPRMPWQDPADIHCSLYKDPDHPCDGLFTPRVPSKDSIFYMSFDYQNECFKEASKRIAEEFDVKR